MAAMTGLLHSPAFAAIDMLLSPRGRLALYHTHTEESLETIYFVNGEYSQQALEDINYILRDHRSGEIKAIDTGLLDLLYAISSKLQTPCPFHIISGYRSKVTNALLRRRSGGVARRSLHLEGKAADIRVPGCDLALLRRVAVDLKSGGVGYYPRPDFVHVDVGRVRYW
jgi:uncharacterized protein YcbK (DUF882 family)